MDLYFAPLACSMASRIAAYEAEQPLTFIRVDTHTKRILPEGGEYLRVNGKGQVPALRTDDGRVLTENAAILQHLAAAWPQARLAPMNAREADLLREWLSFIGTELHAASFTPLLRPDAPEGAKAFALTGLRQRLDWLEAQLTGRATLLTRFSVADAYLIAVLNWTRAVPQLDLAEWPEVAAYMSRMMKRPGVARALADEVPLYRAA